MSLIRATMAVAAISGYAAAACFAVLRDDKVIGPLSSLWTTNTWTAIDTAACAAYPAWNAAFEELGVYWRIVPTFKRTPGGFTLNMINIAGTPDNKYLDKTNSVPVLYLHGARTNLFSFFARTEQNRDYMPLRLANDGVDVYFYMVPGSLNQFDRVDFNEVAIDPTTPGGNEAFWDFEFEEIGKGMQNMIETIIYDRRFITRPPESINCSKVTVIAHSLGTQIALIGLNNPQAPDYVDTLINLAPCPVPRIKYFP